MVMFMVPSVLLMELVHQVKQLLTPVVQSDASPVGPVIGGQVTDRQLYH
jgi:hypothetical protein